MVFENLANEELLHKKPNQTKTQQQNKTKQTLATINSCSCEALLPNVQLAVSKI